MKKAEAPASKWCTPEGSLIKANSTDRFQKSLWPLAWYGIRKANLGLENMDKLVEATDEQRNLIMGPVSYTHLRRLPSLMPHCLTFLQ